MSNQLSSLLSSFYWETAVRIELSLLPSFFYEPDTGIDSHYYEVVL